jgi:gliding motility-associated-like protein
MEKITLSKKNCLANFFDHILVLVLFLLMNFVSQAQGILPAFTLNVTTTAESCRNNGALSFGTTGTDPAATVTYAIYKAPNFTTAIVTTTSNSVTGLSGGAYRINATQSKAGSISNSQVWNGNINADVNPLTFTITKTDETCPNSGAIDVTINTGTPSATNAYRITGPMAIGPQSGSSFTGLTGGSYVVSVTDNCGEIVTKTVTLTTFTPNVIFEPNSSYNTERTACGYGDFRQFLKAGADSNVMVYPLTFDYIVHPPGGGADITTTRTITGPNRFGSTTDDITTSIPFYTTPYVLDLKVTDACGNVFTATKNINAPAEVFADVLPANCSGSYLSLSAKFMVSPLSYEVISAPPGYSIGGASGSNLIGGPGNPIPEGVYQVRITDACGIVINENVTVSTPTPILWVFQGIGCGAGNGTFSVSQNTSTYTFASARVTSGPSGFSNVYPVDVTSKIYPDGYNVVFDDVAGGQYTVETTDNCGHVITTNVNVIGYDQGTVVASKVQKCSSFDVNLSVTGDNLVPSIQNVYYWLQIKDPLSNNWGHPTAGGYSNDAPNSANAQSLINGQQQGSWSVSGTYRIIKTFGTLSLYPGVSVYGYGKKCYDVLSTFDYNGTELKTKDLYSFKCADGMHFNASIAGYNGVEPYTYGITTKDGSPFVVNNGNNSLFTGLTNGIYNFTVTDACGNVVNSLLDVEKLGLPKLTAVNICNGSTTGKLFVDGVPYLNFSWTKDNDPNVLSTSSSLAFPTFNAATDAGVYHVRLTSSTPGSCVNVVLDYKITPNLDNPNSGANSSTPVCRSVASLDLNTLLPTTADSYGIWEETTSPSSGNLNGSIWSPSLSATGSFTFTYTVNGLCSGTSVSTYTVVNTAAPAAPTANVTQPNCTVNTGIITVTAPVAGSDITFTLTGINPVIAAVTNTTGIFSGLSSGIYEVTASAGACRSSASSFTVNMQPVTPATALFSAVTQPTCSIDTGSFTITNYDAAMTYTLTPNTGLSVSATGVVTAPAGTYTATVTDVISGCTSAASASVMINAHPVTPVTPILGNTTQPTCTVATGSFTITNYDATYTYTVTPTTGVSISAAGVVTVPAGTYTVIAALGACTSVPSASTTINVQPVTPLQPLLGTVTQPTTCASPNGSFAITNYDAAYTYRVTPTTGVNVSATGVVTAPAGTYTVMAVLGACSSVPSLSVVINGAPSAPATALFSAVTQPNCSTDTGSFTITNYDAAMTYTFTPNTGVSISATGVVTAPAGTYTVTVTDAISGCISSVSNSVIIQPAICAKNDDYSLTPINGKEGGKTSSVLVNDTLNGLPVQIEEVNLIGITLPSGLTLNTDGTITVAPNTPAGNYVVTYRICEKLNPSNCDITTANVVVEETVIRAIADDYTSMPFNEREGGTTPNVLSNDTLNGEIVSLSEVSLTGVNIPTGFTLNTDGTITVAPNTSAGNYSITYSICEKSNPANCDTTTVTIVIEPSCIIEVFNAVSPNGDGKNDVFRIDGLECFPDNTVEIYNRWGVLVFGIDHYNNSERAFKGISDGRVTINQSEGLPVGTYYYILKYKDNASQSHSKAGYLYLSR